MINPHCLEIWLFDGDAFIHAKDLHDFQGKRGSSIAMSRAVESESRRHRGAQNVYIKGDYKTLCDRL